MFLMACPYFFSPVSKTPSFICNWFTLVIDLFFKELVNFITAAIQDVSLPATGGWMNEVSVYLRKPTEHRPFVSLRAGVWARHLKLPWNVKIRSTWSLGQAKVPWAGLWGAECYVEPLHYYAVLLPKCQVNKMVKVGRFGKITPGENWTSLFLFQWEPYSTFNEFLFV